MRVQVFILKIGLDQVVKLCFYIHSFILQNTFVPKGSGERLKKGLAINKVCTGTFCDETFDFQLQQSLGSLPQADGSSGQTYLLTHSYTGLGNTLECINISRGIGRIEIKSVFIQCTCNPRWTCFLCFQHAWKTNRRRKSLIILQFQFMLSDKAIQRS